ncbi:MAG: acyl carrier protein [Candidatus Didemnitutus sp.]|nr:acyl carrier protein [Candidatus Didemnitutus sp.]
MNTSVPIASVTTAKDFQSESIRHLPETARAAFVRFQADRDPAALDIVLLAILEDFIPKTPAQPLAELPGNTKLIEGMGFDSLAITEVVFFAEDLFGISISNEEIVQVGTLDDLRGFIRTKVSGILVR